MAILNNVTKICRIFALKITPIWSISNMLYAIALEGNIEVDGTHLEERKKILRIY